MQPLIGALQTLTDKSASMEIQALKLKVAQLEARLSLLESDPASRKTPAELLRSNRLYCKTTTPCLHNDDDIDCCF